MDSAPGVKDSLLDPGAYLAHVERAAGAAGFRLEPYGAIAAHPLLALTRRTPGPRPRIYVSAGIHGDEPAAPLALLRLLERGVFDASAVWFLCPLLNPLGFVRGTRENADGIDLNRDYREPSTLEIRAHTRWLERQPPFDLAICLHEDWEARGFYLYELNRHQVRSHARSVLEAVAPVCPIDPSPIIDGRPVDEPGIIRPVADPVLRDRWPEAIYLQSHHSELGYTLETPSALPLAQRVQAHGAAVERLIAATVTAWRETRPQTGTQT